MSRYVQADRPLRINTPLGEDTLLLTAFRGEEAISKLFRFEVELLADHETEIHFEKILGRLATVELGLINGEKRYFNGLVRCFTQGGHERSSEEGAFLRFRAELVPRLWLLTKQIDCRVFQQLSVPDILRRVLRDLDVSYELVGTYLPRDYCVQYGESDFDFVSRLMEEEGIFYYFQHGEKSHQMVVTDLKTPMVSGEGSVTYEQASDGRDKDMRVTAWEKSQELRASEYVLRDYCFELPGNSLEAKQRTIESVTAGAITHKVRGVASAKAQIYEYPGGYAQRFDGISAGGAPRPRELEHIYAERERTVRIRMEEEESASVSVQGVSDCGQFSAGHRFGLTRHFDGDGRYLLTRVRHEATQSGYRSGQGAGAFEYENRFACVPESLPFRPPRVTPKPLIAGVQTATVTGTAGEEIFCDKYGRVKIQFPWDREGKRDAASSCWVRVAQVWAGKGWGAFFWPRIGHEVVVAFEEGDPDQPMIVGSVYNAENMPWFTLPANRELAGFKSASMHGVANKNFNGIVFNDRKGHEHLAIHSEKNLSLNSETDKMINSGRNKGERVAVANVMTVGKLVPHGGGSGGGFDAGNSLKAPPPTGFVGLNAQVVYGDNLQMAFPFNHQIAVGNNLQMCVNPFGLAALSSEAGLATPPNQPEALQVLLGSGLGGNMQFTIGTSAQFTVGQSYEICIGPKKREISAKYPNGADKLNDIDTTLLCILSAVAGVAAGAFAIAYDVMAEHDSEGSSEQGDDPSEAKAEQNGDAERMLLILAYQLLMDILLASILGEALKADKEDKVTNDAPKETKCCEPTIKEVKPGAPTAPLQANDTDLAADAFGVLGILTVLAAECALMADEYSVN